MGSEAKTAINLLSVLPRIFFLTGGAVQIMS